MDPCGVQKVWCTCISYTCSLAHESLCFVAECVHWHHKRVDLICADFRAGICGLDTLHKCWTDGVERAESTGGRAYAYQQATMYKNMCDGLEVAYLQALKLGADPEAYNHRLVS